MANAIVIGNHGPLITSSNYWGSELEANGMFFCSVNAGAIRVLVPRSEQYVIEEMRQAREVVLSRGPWPDQDVAEAVEIMFDDGSDEPFMMYFGGSSFDFLPGEPIPGKEWLISAWVLKKSRLHKSLERPCHWRRVASIPCMAKWGC